MDIVIIACGCCVLGSWVISDSCFSELIVDVGKFELGVFGLGSVVFCGNFHRPPSH